jgi:hypothetical protein
VNGWAGHGCLDSIRLAAGGDERDSDAQSGNVAVTAMGRVVPPASAPQIQAQWQTVLTDIRMA